METLSDNYMDNVRLFDEALGVGRSVDMVSRDYRIGGRRARLWVVDGYGKDETLERMGAFWLSQPSNALEGLTEMQDFADRFITFSEVDIAFDTSELITSVLMGKTLLLVEGLRGGAQIDAKNYPSRGVEEPRTVRSSGGLTTASWRRWCPTWPCSGGASGTAASPWRGSSWGGAPTRTRSSATWTTRRTPSSWRTSGPSCPPLT